MDFSVFLNNIGLQNYESAFLSKYKITVSNVIQINLSH